MRLTVAEVAGATDGHLVVDGRAVTGVAVDSRRVRPGDLFVALPGARTDGHRFVAEACAAGANAVLAAQAVEVPEGCGLVQVADTTLALGRLARHYFESLDRRVRVVAVTGSVGKTTTRALCAAVLATRLGILEPEGNWNTEIGVPLALFRLTAEHEAVVLEYAMRGLGQIAYLCRICPPDVGVVTCIGESHLETLGSVERVAEAKAELVLALPATGAAILNRDDPWQSGMAQRTRGRLVWYGFGSGADVTAHDVALEPQGGVRFRLATPVGEADVRLPLAGRHQVSNALAAAAVGVEFGLTPQDVAQGLATVRAVHRRSEVLDLGSIRLIDDTYNASPTSCLAALETLAALAPPEHRVAVFGDMLELGAETQAAHRTVGEAAARLPVRLVVTVGRQARWIAAAAGDTALHCADRASAAEELTARLRAGDVVLVKGSRGARMEEVVTAVSAWAGSRG